MVLQDRLVDVAQGFSLLLGADVLAEVRLALEGLGVDRAAAGQIATLALEVRELICDLLADLIVFGPADGCAGRADEFVVAYCERHLENLTTE